MIKKLILPVIAGVAALAAIIMFFTVGPKFNKTQLDTLLILGIVCGSSILYCFIVGQILIDKGHDGVLVLKIDYDMAHIQGDQSAGTHDQQTGDNDHYCQK